jgi:hypothetical protein
LLTEEKGENLKPILVKKLDELPSRNSPLSSISSLSYSQHSEIVNEEMIYRHPALVNRTARSKSYDLLIDTDSGYNNIKYQRSMNHCQSRLFAQRPATIYRKHAHTNKPKVYSDLLNLFPEATGAVRSTSYTSHDAARTTPKIKKLNVKKCSVVSAYAKCHSRNQYAKGS